MNIRYKVDVLSKLKAAGWTTYKLRKERVIGERTLQQLRDGVPVSWETVSRLCDLLACDVGDLLTVKPGEVDTPGGIGETATPHPGGRK